MDLREHLVLYVDDERPNRIVFERTFGKRFRVKCVASGEEAIAVLKSETVAVLVTDQRMPKMSGAELLSRVKTLAPDTLRVVVTAYSDLEPILSAVNEGLVVRYIIKPWDRAELDSVLEWAIEAYVVGRQSSALQLRLVQTERLLTLGQVAAYVLHDLRQPLSSISMNAAHLRELAKAAPVVSRVATEKEKDVRITKAERALLRDCAADLADVGAELEAAAQFGLAVLDQLSPLQRLGVASTEMSKAIDPLPIVRLAVSMCRQGNVTAGCSLEYEGPPSLPLVCATSAALLQILINLVRNAQQALEGEGSGGGTVVVSADEHRDTVRFVVRDNGPGIPTEVLGRLGTPFFTTRAEGTGLGIAQCKRLVGATGGELVIESGNGEGTSVSFTIPKAVA